MREFGILLSLVSILIGVLLIFAPQALAKMGEQANRLYNIDSLVYRNRMLFGGLLFLASLFLIYSTF